MNIEKLKQAETRFLDKYPNGFMHPDLSALEKKHKMEKMIALAQECFAKKQFRNTREIGENMTKVISRASMVSMFEKPKFRDVINTMDDNNLKSLTNGLKNFLHGNQQKGFEAMVNSLKPFKLAKWSLLTILPNYYYPNDEVFVKPTTAKGVIQYFEIEGPAYKPTPSWEFYEHYRSNILKIKSMVDLSIAPNNAAFCGFLMMSLDN